MYLLSFGDGQLVGKKTIAWGILSKTFNVSPTKVKFIRIGVSDKYCIEVTAKRPNGKEIVDTWSDELFLNTFHDIVWS